MKTSEAVKLKLVGARAQIKDVMEKLDLHYIVLPTSQIIEHEEDNRCHIFVTLLEEHYQ